MARRNLRNIDERILNKTIAEGARAGIEGVSTKKIASALRITEPTIYVHFQTKDNLLKEAFAKAQKAVFSLPFQPIEEAIDLDNVQHNIELILSQSKAYPDQIIYIYNYRHQKGFRADNPSTSEATKKFLVSIHNAWTNDKNVAEVCAFCPYIENTLYSFVLDLIDSFSYKVARGDVPADPFTAKLVTAVILGGMMNGRKMFLSSLTAADRSLLNQKAIQAGLSK